MLPQVNLLPAEFVEKRELGALKRKIGTAFIGFFVVLVLSYVAVHVEKAAVDRRYDQALEETARLKAEEVKYAEVPRILSQITKKLNLLSETECTERFCGVTISVRLPQPFLMMALSKHFL